MASRSGSGTPPRIYYGWFIVATGILAYALGYGTRYSFSVTFLSLLEEFRWPRDTTALILSFHILVYGFVAPVAGHLIDRVGPRKTMASGTLLLSLGLALSGWGTEPWHFYITFGILTGIGLCFIGAVPFVAVTRNWFERKRGLAFSLMFLGSGSAFAWYPAISFLIGSLGWRSAFLVEALVLSVVLLPLIGGVIRYHPREKGLEVDGIPAGGEEARSRTSSAVQVLNPQWAAVDWTLRKAIRTSRFWLLCLSLFSLWGIMQHVVLAHHVAFATDLGYTRAYASAVLSLFGVGFVLGCLGSSISDRIGREETMTIGTVAGISGVFLLLFMEDTSHPWMLSTYAIAFGLGNGLCSPTVTAMITDIFQGPRVGGTIGTIWLSFALGGAIGPWLGGWIYESTRSYHGAFVVSMVMYAVACGSTWLAAPRKVRLVPGRAGTS